MAHLSATRRMVFVHPAHRTVGVSGDRMAPRPYCRIDGVPTDDFSVVSLRAILAADALDAKARAALASFERAVRGQGDVKCRRVDLDAVKAGSATVADADCVVVFSQGLYIARHWADIDAAAVQGGTDSPVQGAADIPAQGGADIPVCHVAHNLSGSQECPPHLDECLAQPSDREPMQVELVAEACWHPVLEGVEPFVSHHRTAHWLPVAGDATILLCGRAAGEVQPVAWIGNGSYGRIFSTSLAHPNDFRQSAFVRLLLNALVWVSR